MTSAQLLEASIRIQDRDLLSLLDGYERVNMFVVMNVKYLKETIRHEGRSVAAQEDEATQSANRQIALHEAATSGVTIHDLPEEVLIKVFSYLSVEDLALRVRFVCKRWASASGDAEVWRGKTYEPFPHSPVSHIQNVLKQAPQLQAFCASSFFSDGVLTSIFFAIISNLSHIRRLSVPVSLGNHAVVRYLLLNKCHSITVLEIRFRRGFMVHESVESYSEEILKCVGMCLNLQSLTISGSILCDSNAFREIATRCNQLKKLNVQNSNIYANNVEHLLERNAYTIVSLNLAWDYNGRDGTLPVVAKHCRKLEKLSVVEPDGMFGFKVTANDLIALENMVSLKELSMPCLKDDVLSGFVCLFQKNVFRNLVKLDFSYCRWVKNPLLEVIFKTCCNLKVLLLQHCYEITGSGFEFVHCVTQLQHLNLEGCAGLRDNAIRHIVQCKNLRYLNVNRIFVFKLDSLKLCCDHLKLLRELHMIVHGISQDDLKNIPDHLLTYLQYMKFCW